MILLETEGLTLRIGTRTLCRDLTLRIQAGENWAVLGPNGSGKTTLLHALAGLKPGMRTQVRLMGRHLTGWPARERARRLGLLLQDYGTGLPATVLETTMTGRYPVGENRFSSTTDDMAAARAALAETGMRGFETRWVPTLSGGERRRVEIAALLAQNPPLLLADEPTQHLDLRHQIEMLALITARAQRPGHANVLVLHDLNLATRFCSHALLLFADGTHSLGTVTEQLRPESLDRLYGWPVMPVSNGQYTGFLPG